MRGRILQYNGNDGRGIIVVDGQQYEFGISAWKGETAPAVGKAVEVVLADGKLQTVMLVADDVLLREKTAELTGKLGTMVGGLSAGLSKGGASGAGGSVLGFYGRNLLVAYGVFLLGTLVFNAISLKFFGTSEGKPLFEIASLLSQLGAGKGIKAGLLLAYGGFAVPYFWRDRRGWLLLLMPLLVVLWALWSGRHAITGGSGGGPMGQGASDVFSLGLGAYLAIVSAVVLAVAGVKRYLTAG
jgi:hypothetical protein